MKKIALGVIASLTIATVSLQANTTKYSGFSYIGFGVETATYEETGLTADGKHFKSSATASSPVYTSGSLININNIFDFSIDATSTLSPTQTEEKWETDGIVTQADQYDTVQSDMKFLLHYKINNNHRFVLGANYNLFSMKRHTYTNPADGSAILSNGNPIGLNQEDISTLNLMGGYWFEHNSFSNGGMRVSVSALYGKPLSTKATNTSTSSIEFNTKSGSTLNLNGYIGFEVYKGLEIGMFGSYTYKKKSGEDKETVGADTITWPENSLETYRYGISFVWNFDVK